MKFEGEYEVAIASLYGETKLVAEVPRGESGRPYAEPVHTPREIRLIGSRGREFGILLGKRVRVTITIEPVEDANG